MTAPVLSPADLEHFIAHGYVKVPKAVDPTVLRDWSSRLWTRLGYDPADRSTWKEGKVHMPNLEMRPVAEIAPRAWEAMIELMGGRERIAEPVLWGDGFVANLAFQADQAWVPAGPQAQGWHKDGDFFYHFLDSPEQGLLTIILWSDVRHRGGPTYLACDSVGHVARFLAEHREGISPMNGFPTRQFIERCTDFREATGEAGDVFLMHPFMVHASSQNLLGVPRLITNPAVHLREPMRFDRERDEDHSPVERAVLRALGVRRYAFAPTGERRPFVPERLRIQQRMLEEEKRRLAAAGAPQPAS